MQSQEHNLILKRLHRFERRARWHWAERLITLGLVARLLVMGPAGVSLRKQASRIRPLEAGARLYFTESMNAARHALLVRPALDPQTILEDEREASMDAMPIPPVTAAHATMASAVPHNHKRAALLAERQPTSNQTSASRTMASRATQTPAATPESALAWSSSVSAAERQMARAADSNAEQVASLMDGPFASGTLSADTTSGGLPAFELSTPEALWKTVGAAKLHRQFAAGRDPFSFAAPYAEPSGVSAQTPAMGSSNSRPPAPGSMPDASSATTSTESAAAAQGTVPALPAVTLKALGYAESADGSAQAVLTDGTTLYVVNEGEEFAERFRVISIRPEDLEVEDEYTNQTFRLPLGN